MIDFCYWPTPNGWKISTMLKETALSHELKPVNIGKDLRRQGQHTEESRKIPFGQTAQSLKPGD